jgi:hypothetical protein
MNLEVVRCDGGVKILLDGIEIRGVTNYSIVSTAASDMPELTIKLLVNYPVCRTATCNTAEVLDSIFEGLKNLATHDIDIKGRY